MWDPTGHEAFKPRALPTPAWCGSHLLVPSLSPDCCVDCCKDSDTSYWQTMFLSCHMLPVSFLSQNVEFNLRRHPSLTPHHHSVLNYFLWFHLFPLLFYKIYVIVLFVGYLSCYNIIPEYKNLILFGTLPPSWTVQGPSNILIPFTFLPT